jgi:hypothetical protein
LAYRSRIQLRALRALIVCTCGALGVSLPAQTNTLPSARLIGAREYKVPGRVDSSVPMLWTRVGGQLTLVAFASWGGIPVRMAGPDLEHLQLAGDPVLTPHPGDGIWFESVIADQTDTMWYMFYHHEQPATKLDDPRGWSTPRKILNGGNWYPQIAGREQGTGSDKQMGRIARFFLTGRSTGYIEFSGP